MGNQKTTGKGSQERTGKVARAIICNPAIPPKSRLIYALLARQAKSEIESSIATSDLIRESGMSKYTFYKHMSFLTDRGIVKKRHDKNRNRKTIFTLYDSGNGSDQE